MRVVGLLVAVLIVGCSGVADKADNSTFVATREWQEIKEGQGIPAGLHVRINLQTGKKEAKLLDESEDQGNTSDGALSTVPEEVNETPSKGTAKHKLKISKTLSQALKNLPKDRLGVEYSPEKLEQIKREYKSYKELKESFDDLRKRFKSDAEIITQLVGEYRNLTKGEQEVPLTAQAKANAQLRILEDFNYMVHQIDNAIWFIDEGGLDQILLPIVVNETHIGLRVQAMRVLGALTLNNPTAQIKVFERNFGSHLSQILISSTNTEELSTALYAFGSLLRKFPLAQQRILSTSGTQALIAVLSKECELKVKAKAATFISDVIIEKQLVLSTSAESNSPLAAAQYAELNLPEWLQSNAFCETFDVLISTGLYELLKQPDLMEYFAHTVESTQSFCAPQWSQSPEMRHTLLTLKNRYMQSQEEYRMEVAQQIEKLIAALYAASELHDEL